MDELFVGRFLFPVASFAMLKVVGDKKGGLLGEITMVSGNNCLILLLLRDHVVIHLGWGCAAQVVTEASKIVCGGALVLALLAVIILAGPASLKVPLKSSGVVLYFAVACCYGFMTFVGDSDRDGDQDFADIFRYADSNNDGILSLAEAGLVAVVPTLVFLTLCYITVYKGGAGRSVRLGLITGAAIYASIVVIGDRDGDGDRDARDLTIYADGDRSGDVSVAEAAEASVLPFFSLVASSVCFGVTLYVLSWVVFLRDALSFLFGGDSAKRKSS